MTDGTPSELDLIKLYEEGKHRRYSLLFAVNGGAFAIGKLFVENSHAPNCPQLGGLTTTDLAFGGAIFSIVMITDIFAFGWKMKMHPKAADLFELPGMIVLFLSGFLLSTGWLFVACPQADRFMLILCSTAAILFGWFVVYLFYCWKKRKNRKSLSKALA